MTARIEFTDEAFGEGGFATVLNLLKGFSVVVQGKHINDQHGEILDVDDESTLILRTPSGGTVGIDFPLIETVTYL